jgi:hypothetical protein
MSAFACWTERETWGTQPPNKSFKLTRGPVTILALRKNRALRGEAPLSSCSLTLALI